MLQGLAKSICVNAKKTAAADVTPAAVDWANCGLIVNYYTYVYSAQKITGINTTITLRTVFSATAFSHLMYKVQSTSTVPASSSTPASNGYTNILHNGTLTVSNDQWIVFCAKVSSTTNTTVTVNNTSDGNATLDTFTAQSRNIPF